MQTDLETLRKITAEEEQVIKFRPSPNFQNMKRFLKKKIVDTAYTHEPPESFDPEPDALCKAEKKEVKPIIQPPLPLYPPPPDSPPGNLITIKKELEDDYSSSNEDTSGINIGQVNNQPMSAPEDTKEKKTRICKDFIRGTCIRKQCKYAHERDLSQLEGIYTFCWNYQNSICVIPNCKYVHASPFEEGEFYRTGVLPPHALKNIKQSNQKVNILPPPPPPPEEPPQEVAPATFTNPPPPIYTPVTVDNAVPALVPPPTLSKATTVAGDYRLPQLSQNTSPLTATAPNTESGDQTPKCNSCVDMEYRLQYNKSKVEEMMHSSKALDEKMTHLDKKMNKLYSVLVTLLTPGQTKSQVALQISNENDKKFLQQLSSLLQAAELNNVR